MRRAVSVIERKGDNLSLCKYEFNGFHSVVTRSGQSVRLQQLVSCLLRISCSLRISWPRSLLMSGDRPHLCARPRVVNIIQHIVLTCFNRDTNYETDDGMINFSISRCVSCGCAWTGKWTVHTRASVHQGCS